jgi:hypothetical protein
LKRQELASTLIVRDSYAPEKVKLALRTTWQATAACTAKDICSVRTQRRASTVAERHSAT